jgi:hypothetical protein
MTLYYSPSAKGFYDTDMNYPNLPSDIIEISKEKHKELLEGTNLHHKTIEVSNNELILVDQVAVATWEIIRNKRNRLLLSSDFTQMPDWPGDKAAWAVYRQSLRDIPQTYSNPEDVVWPTSPGEG